MKLQLENIPQKFIINENMTVNTLSNMRFILAGVQISDKCHEEHSLQNGHMITSSLVLPQINLLYLIRSLAILFYFILFGA
jgi:hypothetical protein